MFTDKSVLSKHSRNFPSESLNSHSTDHLILNEHYCVTAISEFMLPRSAVDWIQDMQVIASIAASYKDDEKGFRTDKNT